MRKQKVNPMKHVIIPIAGFARAGKDTLANAIFDQLEQDEPEYSAIVMKFADALKQSLQEALDEAGVAIDIFTEDTGKKAALRPLLVNFGEYCRSQNPDVWVNKVIQNINTWADETTAEAGSTGSVVLIPDLRYCNEYEKLEALCIKRGWEFVPIYIEREGNLPANNAEAESIGLMAAHGYFRKGNALQVGFADGSVELISQWASKFTQSMSLYR
jgi:hypothetical protein